MIVCTLNGKMAYPSSSDKIKVTYENQYVKDSRLIYLRYHVPDGYRGQP